MGVEIAGSEGVPRRDRGERLHRSAGPSQQGDTVRRSETRDPTRRIGDVHGGHGRKDAAVLRRLRQSLHDGQTPIVFRVTPVLGDVHLGKQDIELTRMRHQFQRFREDHFCFVDHPRVQWVGRVQEVGKAFLEGGHELIRHRRKFESGGLCGIGEHAALASGFGDRSEPHTRGPLGLPQDFQCLHEGRGVGYFDSSVVVNEVGERNARTNHGSRVSQRGLCCNA